jgi:hypothetical protein
MQNTAYRPNEPFVRPVSPWTLRAWPPLLWQAGQRGGLQFHHLGTRVTMSGDRSFGVAGQTMWGGHSAAGTAGVAWDWIQISNGIVAMADPMSVVTNLRLVGDEGEVLTAQEAARFLNEIVHQLPWQHEVTRALCGPTQ